MIAYCIVTSLLNAVVSVVLGFAVLLKDPRKRQNHLFWWFTASYAAWSFFYFRWQIADSAEGALFHARLLLGFSTFIPITYFHFVARLTGLGGRREIRVGYACAVAIALFTPTPHLVARVEPEMMFEWWPKGGPVFPFYIALFAYFTVRAWVVLFKAYRTSGYTRRNQLGYVCVATIVGWIGGLTNFLLWFGIPIPPIGNGLALVYILGVGYAMVRFRLVELNRLAVRLTAYGAIVLVLSPLVPAVFAMVVWLTGAGPEDASVLVIGGVLVATLLFVAVHFLKARVDDLLAATVLKEDFQGRDQLRSLAQRLTTMASEEEMFDESILAVVKALDVDGAAIVVRGELEPAGITRAAVGFSEDFKVSFRLESGRPISRLLDRSRRSVVIEELDLGAPDEVAAEVSRIAKTHGIAAIVPIQAESALLGALFLKQRARNRLYTGPVLALLEGVCLQIGLNLRLRQIERRASQTEKLISLGTLAAGLAHELRNPLTSIQTFAALLEENAGDVQFQREFADVMRRDIARIVGIVENVSSFATRGTVKFSFVRLGEVIRAAREITDVRLRENGVAFECDDAAAVPVYGNYNQLLQVFINLFQNAADALHGVAEARLEVRTREHATAEGVSVEVSVKDNGRGIEPEVISRIFDPFVTTKSTGSRTGTGGMGLGLSIVKRVIDVHHGLIRAVSEQGAGTEFLISLPTAPAAEG